MTDTFNAELNQLQQQQALFTQALAAMLQGKWTAGADTVEAYLYALDPQFQGTLDLDKPVVESEYEQAPKG